MIRVILESASAEIAVVDQNGNEAILCQSNEPRFPLLSQVDTFSYAVFNRDDMPQLLSELETVAMETENDLGEVISLAQRCLEEAGTTLAYTPFI
jgi:hypothetical protein